ncbi:MAG: hypothetical protein P1V29_00890, partial [Gammaproteobacteria bacterium]|nr:hypothetical protein [Gammaproteobacteria bacterium]
MSPSLPGRGDTPGDDGPNGASAQNGADAGDSASGQQGRGSDAGQSGPLGSQSSVLGSPSGDYSLDTLPDGVLSGRSASAGGSAGSSAGSPAGDQTANTNGAGAGSGTMTTSERAAVLDEQLRRGYETFDGFILGERERAQAETNAGGASAQPGAEDGAGDGGQMPQILQAPGANG